MSRRDSPRTRPSEDCCIRRWRTTAGYIIGQGPSAPKPQNPAPEVHPERGDTGPDGYGAAAGPLGSSTAWNYYREEDLGRIIAQSAALMGVAIDEQGAAQIAQRSRGTPRVANRLLRRVRDYADVKSDGVITAKEARHALDMMEVDALGLDEVDRKILTTIMENFGGGPVGIRPSSRDARRRTRSSRSTTGSDADSVPGSGPCSGSGAHGKGLKKHMAFSAPPRPSRARRSSD